MFDSLARLFRTDEAVERDIPGSLALAALLVEAARRDGDYAADERHAILRLLGIPDRESGLARARVLARIG